MVVIEESKHGFESHQLLFNLISGFTIKLRGRDSYDSHVYMKDAGLPVPNQQTIFALCVSEGYHAGKVAAYLVFATSRKRVLESFRMKDPPIGREGVWPASVQRTHKYAARQ